jgi:hypothetical protein
MQRQLSNSGTAAAKQRVTGHNKRRAMGSVSDCPLREFLSGNVYWFSGTTRGGWLVYLHATLRVVRGDRQGTQRPGVYLGHPLPGSPS